MLTQRTRTIAVDVLAVVISVGLFVGRLAFDWGPAPSWIGMAVLVGLVLWRMKHRSPYRNQSSDLHLRT